MLESHRLKRSGKIGGATLPFKVNPLWARGCGAYTPDPYPSCFPPKNSRAAMERTFVMFKPDCLERGLVGRILSRFEEKGLRLVAMKMLRITPSVAKQHYAEHLAKPFYAGLEEFITAAPVVACVFEGPEVVRVVREMLGATCGLKAAAGTSRGDYSSSRQMNLVHASDSPESAAREVGIYFEESEIQAWNPTLACWYQAPCEA